MEATQSGDQDQHRRGRPLARPLAASSTAAIRTSAGDAERSLTALSDKVSRVLKQNADEVERTLLAVSTEVARPLRRQSRRDRRGGTASTDEMTAILSDKSGGLLAAIAKKSEEFADNVSRATDQAVQSIDERASPSPGTMMDN